MVILRTILSSDISLIFDFIFEIYLTREFIKFVNIVELRRIRHKTLNVFSKSSTYWIEDPSVFSKSSYTILLFSILRKIIKYREVGTQIERSYYVKHWMSQV